MQTRRQAPIANETVWACPDCNGAVRAEGATERSPLLCVGCGARYRHPRLALLLSLVLPGLGSLYLRRWVWGGIVFLTGTGTFLWAVWRLKVHLTDAWGKTELQAIQPTIQAMLGDTALGLGLLMLAFGLDVLVVWLLRDRLKRL